MVTIEKLTPRRNVNYNRLIQSIITKHEHKNIIFIVETGSVLDLDNGRYFIDNGGGIGCTAWYLTFGYYPFYAEETNDYLGWLEHYEFFGLENLKNKSGGYSFATNNRIEPRRQTGHY